MANVVEVRLPDIGDFEAVDVIEVLVSPGDHVAKESSLITLESDKATMEVPSPRAGTVRELKVAVGDKVSQGDVILTLEADGAEGAEEPEVVPPAERAEPEAAAGAAESEVAEEPAPKGEIPASDIRAEVLVLGAGPGGYTAAFRAADLGRKVVLVERYPELGGVCLNVGCIPSKALLHAAEVIEEAGAMGEAGLRFNRPEIDVDRLRAWKERVVKQLTSGLGKLAQQRKVRVVQGRGTFTGPHQIQVQEKEGTTSVSFENAIIAVGSRPIELPDVPNEDARVLDSTSALELPAVGRDLLVIGGGIIGLEMAAVYHALGTKVTVAELSDGLLPGVDRDLVKPLQRRIQSRCEDIHVNTRVAKVEADSERLTAHFEGEGAPESRRFDYVLVAVGRRPNGDGIGAEAAGVHVDERGNVPVDAQRRTNVPHIFAIGDVAGGPQLAHKASHEGKVAAEVAAGMNRAFDARAIPSVAYTDPEVAWAGITEQQAEAQGVEYGKGMFPWAASGRSLSMGRNEGLTKLLFERDSGRIIGAGLVGPRAGELIAELTLAIEMGCDAADIGLTIHPHPTLSESIGMAAEAFEGTVTDLYVPTKR
ncbi:MAG: dihydrolipoyl dehydrogenase [Gammaproteobacteria bacterium]|nr:dihydrolipoyl dehydrogenase [Gammaproteobacteria bacterium]NIR99047.1 dihydrolipoyl dehydrogenase [Gammaproteobacteria bacterium]NIT64670.1 dihydrolipoyl dehydrogenase [Gammaproteobacteria bacterium]NIY33250.1 dihydrolipoyl dehydrogenase [Gammaproteobacteria bacterium]